MNSTQQSHWKNVLLGIVLWRVALYLIAATAFWFIPFKSSFVDAEMLAALPLPHWLSAWSNFDGIHYLTLATRGYLAVGFIQAFFPVLPLLLKSVWILTDNLSTVVLFGQALAFGCFFVALMLYQKVHAAYATVGQRHSNWLLVLLLLFPTSLFFAGVYTESLFLVLALGSFVAAARRRWWLAGILAGIASGTRVVGIMLVPALLIELGLQTGLWQRQTLFSGTKLASWARTNLVALIAISSGVTGLVLYSSYLWYYFSDPLYYFHVQSEFGGGRQESLVMLPQVAWRYLKIFATVPLDLRYLIYLQEFLAGAGSFLLLLFNRKNVRPSIWFFSLAVLLLPTLTGTFSSMGRYILVAPAIFIILNDWLGKHPRARILWLFICAVLLMINTILFIQGYWVA